MFSMRPIIRWAGSKRQALPILAEYWNPNFKRYIEPFVGSAALFFRLQPKKAILSDLNCQLIETYKVLREMPEELHDAVVRLDNNEKNYYTIRAQDETKLQFFDRAVRFLYLNRYCFNGVYRTNAQGKFNVPYGHGKLGVVPSIESFRRSAVLLGQAQLKSCDFGATIKLAGKGDFVYLDPPYAVESRRIFRQYDKRNFQRADIERLSKHLEAMHKRGAAFVVSYADCIEAKEFFSRWTIRRIRVRRNVAGYASARRIANEVLVTNIK